MSDLPPLPPGWTLRPQGFTPPPAAPAAATATIPPQGWTLRDPAVPQAAAPVPGATVDQATQFGATAGIRGLTGIPDALLEGPFGWIRRFIDPRLANIEEGIKGQPGRTLGNKAFEVTGIPEYEPKTGLGRVGMATATGGISGAPFGVVPAVVGAISGATGQTVQEATGDERAATIASMVPGGVLSAAGTRARGRTAPAIEGAGINPTLGQAMGGWVNRVEQGIAGIPYLGDYVKGGRAKAGEEFDLGAINRGLSHVGEELPRGTPVNRATIEKADNLVGNRYDRISPHLNMSFDPQFASGLTDIFRKATMLPSELQNQLRNTVREELLRRAPNGQLTGEMFREAESTLGQTGQDFRHSPNPNDRTFGGLVLDLQRELRGNLRRSNPDRATELANIHRAYAELERVGVAAARLGTGAGGQLEHGAFSPAQLSSASRQLDRTVNKRAFREGRSLMQDYAEGGQRLLGDTLPDSGTATRGMTAAGAGAGITGLIDPGTIAAVLGTGTGLRMLYSPQGRAAMNYFLRRPEQAAFSGLLGSAAEAQY